MASEIKVDTVSEKTSANGVTIDGVNIKDSALATAGSVPLSTIDIDGGTDIGAAIVDADLFIIDDGAGGTNRKVAASRIKTYAGTTINNATANEIVTIGSTTTELDAEANLTFSGSALQCTATLTVGVDDTGHDVKFFGATSGSYALWDQNGDALQLIASGLGVVSAKDLGTGIHVRTSDSGASVHADAGELVLEAGGAHVGLSMLCDTNMKGTIYFGDANDNDVGQVAYNHSDNSMQFTTDATERMRLDGGGKMLIGTTSTNLVAGNTAGIAFGTNESGSDSVGGAQFSRDGGMAVAINRLSDDGALQVLYQAGSLEGTISVSGSTVAYGTFCGTHWSRLSDNSKPTILRGTVMESIATMMDWYQATSDVAESTDGEGNVTPAHQVKENVALPDGKSVGDSVTFTSGGEEYTGVYVKEDNEQLPMCKISNTADSKAVYGVFMAWDDTDDGNDGDVNDMYIAALGAFVVRVHSGETVAIGDYLQSKGDGTAKVQADDILRASTIAKVTSTTKTITHGDGSYCVPCTLHCG